MARPARPAAAIHRPSRAARRSLRRIVSVADRLPQPTVRKTQRQCNVQAARAVLAREAAGKGVQGSLQKISAPTGEVSSRRTRQSDQHLVQSTGRHTSKQAHGVERRERWMEASDHSYPVLIDAPRHAGRRLPFQDQTPPAPPAQPARRSTKALRPTPRPAAVGAGAPAAGLRRACSPTQSRRPAATRTPGNAPNTGGR